jgi:hypothetical protein
MNFEIVGNSINAVLTDGSYRRFATSFPKKINGHGFGKLDPKNILENKIFSNDFTSQPTDTQLWLTFTIHNGKKDMQFALCLEETFHQLSISNMPNIPDTCKERFMILQNQVSYLSAKLTEALEKINELEELNNSNNNCGYNSCGY